MITSIPGWLVRLRRPRSPRTIALWLALWLAIVGNLALWRELYRIGGGAPAHRSLRELAPEEREPFRRRVHDLLERVADAVAFAALL